MELNPEIKRILKECKVEVSEGTLALLAIYHDLDADRVCSEETIKAINTTGIVEKDYRTELIQWNVPLYKGEETNFSWVSEWMHPFGVMNPDRKGTLVDVKRRMIGFFKEYPEWRKEDVFKARDAYLASIKDTKFLMKSHKFISDGVGAMRKSTLLEWCERTSQQKATDEGYQRGQIIK